MRKGKKLNVKIYELIPETANQIGEFSGLSYRKLFTSIKLGQAFGPYSFKDAHRAKCAGDRQGFKSHMRRVMSDGYLVVRDG